MRNGDVNNINTAKYAPNNLLNKDINLLNVFREFYTIEII